MTSVIYMSLVKLVTPQNFHIKSNFVLCIYLNVQTKTSIKRYMDIFYVYMGALQRITLFSFIEMHALFTIYIYRGVSRVNNILIYRYAKASNVNTYYVSIINCAIIHMYIQYTRVSCILYERDRQLSYQFPWSLLNLFSF